MNMIASKNTQLTSRFLL